MVTKYSFNFRLEGVPTREEALFKAYVRVVAFRLEHNWHHQNVSPHLVVRCDASNEGNSLCQGADLVHVLVLSKHGNGENFLRLPLNSGAIELALNRIGRLIVLKLARDQIASTYCDQSYRLLRWPSAALLPNSSRMRLAAIMVGQFISTSELQKRSGLEFDSCKLFVEDMLKNDLLEFHVVNNEINTDVENNDKRSIHPGIFSLIRSSLSRLVVGGG